MRFINNIVTPSNPVLEDLLIFQMNQDLQTKLSWLDNLFPKAEKLRVNDDRTKHGQKTLYYPAVFENKHNYLSMFPDGSSGNYLFWLMHDSTDSIIDFKMSQYNYFKQQFSCIFFLHLPSVTQSLEDRNTAIVKREIIRAFAHVKAANLNKVELVNTEEEVQNIFKEFNFTNIDDQYTMHPYYMIRVNGFLYFNDNCNL